MPEKATMAKVKVEAELLAAQNACFLVGWLGCDGFMIL
jgi:hypothetical protein